MAQRAGTSGAASHTIASTRATLAWGDAAFDDITYGNSLTTYSYDHTYALASGTNRIWGQSPGSRRYNVGDSLESNAHNILVKNNIRFFSANDPRVPPMYTVGIDARLIEAAAKLKAGDAAGRLGILNTLHSTTLTIGTVTTPKVAVLTGPGVGIGAGREPPHRHGGKEQSDLHRLPGPNGLTPVE